MAPTCLPRLLEHSHPAEAHSHLAAVFTGPAGGPYGFDEEEEGGWTGESGAADDDGWVHYDTSNWSVEGEACCRCFCGATVACPGAGATWLLTTPCAVCPCRKPPAAAAAPAAPPPAAANGGS